MPPTFIYFVAFSVWALLACIVWLVAGVMVLIRQTRREGWALASAMGGTFPTVILFQAAIAPVIAVMVIGMAWLSGIIDPASAVTHKTSNGLVIAMALATALLCFLMVLIVSILGFLEGWLAGWRCAHGERLRDAIQRGPTARLLRRFGFKQLRQAQ